MNDTLTNYDMTAMNIIVAFVVILTVAFLAAWAASPRLRAWLEKPNHTFRESAQNYDAALKTANMAEGRKTL